MQNGNNQILALKVAYVAGIFSLIVCVVMLLNYWQLVSTDPLESEALKTMVERFQEDKTNEELKLEIRNLDLMTRNAYFTNQWQIRTGAYLLIAGIIITVAAMRIYFSLATSLAKPTSKETDMVAELLQSRRWILYTLSLFFGLALIASFLSMDHLSKTYELPSTVNQEDEIPVTEIVRSNEQDLTPDQELEDTNNSLAEMEDSPPAEVEAQVSESASTSGGNPVTSPLNAQLVAPEHDQIIENFPAFRGPYGQGISHHRNIPSSWDGVTGDNILWKVPLPLPGFNSPVVWGDALYLTGADEEQESIFCFDVHTGELLWEHKITGLNRIKISTTEDTGFAAPSSTTDGRYVLAIFASGNLVCVDTKGQQIWAKNIGVPDNHYGHSSSLLVWKDLVFVQFDTNDEGRVLAFDVQTGELAWETPRTSKISWASPILANRNNQLELILASSPQVAGYDPETGKELWAYDCLSGEVGPSPAFDNGVVYATNEYAKLVAFKPNKTVEVLWESYDYLSEVSSPVVSDELLFIGTSYGVIACHDKLTGELLWEFECDESIYASPIIAEDKVHFLDRKGIMHILSVDRTLKVLAQPQLDENVVSTPAFSEGRIYIRGFENLYCIGS